MAVKEAVAVHRAVITCAFCHGRGVDPFGVMSYLSACCVCGGRGTVSIRDPYVPCAFCRSVGVYPHSRLTCTACGGMGASWVKTPHRPCSHCGGTGVSPRGEAELYCFVCHGAGAVTGNG